MYAIVGNPSNPVRVICIKVVDKLNAEGPKWKYYLSTCGGTKKLKCSVRATGFVKRSIQEKTSLLLTCAVLRHSPRKKEKLTSEIAKGNIHIYQCPKGSTICSEINVGVDNIGPDLSRPNGSTCPFTSKEKVC